jgi:23S rRNA (pseudouridine1915-N3)-methyltransferase
MKVRVLWPGKTKHQHFRDAIVDYTGRIKRFVAFEIVEIKEHSSSDRHRNQRIKQESKSLRNAAGKRIIVVLDPAGKQLTSEEFASWINKQSNDIDFVVGGPEGLDIPDADFQLSLGKLTIAHDLARVLLLEQIYRAFTILKNIPYHK